MARAAATRPSGRCLIEHGHLQAVTSLMESFRVFPGHFVSRISQRALRHPSRRHVGISICYKPASSIPLTFRSADGGASINWRCSRTPDCDKESGRRSIFVQIRTSVANASVLPYVRTSCYARTGVLGVRSGVSRSLDESRCPAQAQSRPAPTRSAIQFRPGSTNV